jgi:hypothetical protein
LVDALTSTPTNWTLYSNSTLSPILGTNTILFQGVGPNNKVGLGNITLIYGQIGVAPVNTTVTNNSFKSTYIYGSLTALDYISGGTTISGSISTQRHYNYCYSTLPSVLPSTAIGCTYPYTNTATTILINSFTNSSAFSIPIGLYIVDAYCIFTPGSSAVHTLKLGISTTAGVISAFNYTVDNVLVASVLPHSISYKHYLSNTATTSYYFVFNTNLAGNLNGTLNGKFIRIA